MVFVLFEFFEDGYNEEINWYWDDCVLDVYFYFCLINWYWFNVKYICGFDIKVIEYCIGYYGVEYDGYVVW